MGVSSSASALTYSPFGINVDGDGAAGIDINVLELMNFEGISFVNNTFTSQVAFNFTNAGVFRVVSDDNGNSTPFNGKELTATFTGGAGTGTLGGSITFTSGALDFYVDDTPDYATPGGSAGANIYGANNGTHIGTFDLTFGNGLINPLGVPNGAISLGFKATNLVAGYWFDEWGNDLFNNTNVVNFVTNNASRVAALSTLAKNEIVCQLNGFDCPTGNSFDNLPQTFVLSGNGQDRMAIPEPASLALIGIGLLGMSFKRRQA
jgi:hypothetical protein